MQQMNEGGFFLFFYLTQKIPCIVVLRIEMCEKIIFIHYLLENQCQSFSYVTLNQAEEQFLNV